MLNYTLKSESTNSSTEKTLTYIGKGNVTNYGYKFNNGMLESSSFYVDLYKSSSLIDFLLERYWILDIDKQDDGSYYYYLGTTDLKTVVAGWLSTSGTIVLYYPMPSTTRGDNLTESIFNIKQSVIESLRVKIKRAVFDSRVQ